jgi:hypothetical protein
MRKRLQASNVKIRESIVPRTGDTPILPLRSRRRRRRIEFPEDLAGSPASFEGSASPVLAENVLIPAF